MCKENPIKGVGLGNFMNEIDSHKQRGIYPKRFATHEAHDAYFGIVGQLGILHLVFLLLFVRSIIIVYNRLDKHVKYPILLYLLYMMIESMSIGSFHFRHYYVFFAILVVLSRKNIISNN